MSLRLLTLLTLGGVMNCALAVPPSPIGPLTISGNCQNQGAKIELIVHEKERTFEVIVRDFGNQSSTDKARASSLERQVCSVVIPMTTGNGKDKGVEASAKIKWLVSIKNEGGNRISFYREYFWAGETGQKLTTEWSKSSSEEITDSVQLKSRDAKRTSESLRLQFSYVIRKSEKSRATMVNFSGQSQWRY